MSDTTPTDALDAQAAGLIQRVERTTAQRCSQLHAAAETRAHEILSSGRAEARERVRNAVAQERSRMEQGLRQAQARADLEAHQRAQKEIRSLLEHMWTEVESILKSRWKDPTERRVWVEAAIAEASALFGGRAWHIEYGAGWSDAERRQVEDQVRRRGATSIEWVFDSALTAGLKIRADSACLSATIPGLTARRDEVESAFLADYLALQPPPDPQGQQS